MNDPPSRHGDMTARGDNRQTRHWWLWLILGVALVTAGGFAYDWLQGRQRGTPPGASSPDGVWTTAPQGPQVPVDLPRTPVTAVPIEDQASEQPIAERASPGTSPSPRPSPRLSE